MKYVTTVMIIFTHEMVRVQYINRQTHTFFISLSGISCTAKSNCNCNCTDDTTHTHTQAHTLHSSVKKKKKPQKNQRKNKKQTLNLFLRASIKRAALLAVQKVVPATCVSPLPYTHDRQTDGSNQPSLSPVHHEVRNHERGGNIENLYKSASALRGVGRAKRTCPLNRRHVLKTAA